MKKSKTNEAYSQRNTTIGKYIFLFAFLGSAVYYTLPKKNIDGTFSNSNDCELPFLASLHEESTQEDPCDSVENPYEEVFVENFQPTFEETVLLANTEEVVPPEIVRTEPCLATVTARNLEGRGIGYDHGYSSLTGLFFPIHTGNNLWPLLDTRFHYFNNNEFAANAGLGIRYNDEKRKKIYGFNIFYDYRSDHSQSLNFNQIGMGLEFLWKKLDVRLNGYMPLESEKEIHHDSETGETKVKAAMAGINAEFGRSVLKVRNLAVYAAIGPYFYSGDVRHSTVGGQFRLNMRIAKYITLEGRVSYDPLFNTRGEGIIGLNFPISCGKGNKAVQKRLSQNIQRNEIIVLDKYYK